VLAGAADRGHGDDTVIACGLAAVIVCARAMIARGGEMIARGGEMIPRGGGMIACGNVVVAASATSQ
jgi:uncharacterized Zn-binding protein involved in type VI secretion